MAKKRNAGQPSEVSSKPQSTGQRGTGRSKATDQSSQNEGVAAVATITQTVDDKARLFEEFQAWMDSRLAKRPMAESPAQAEEAAPVQDQPQRGPARKHPDQGVRRLAIDISVETWKVMKVESARTGKTIKDLLCECVVDRYGGQTVAEAKRKAKFVMGATAPPITAEPAQADKPARPRVQIEPQKRNERKAGTPSVGADILFSVVDKSKNA